MREVVMTLRTAGLGQGDRITVGGLDDRCGSVGHGVGVEVPGLEGVFVIDADDLLELADRIRADRLVAADAAEATR